MGEAIGAVLAFAVGVGLSPIPIIAVVLVLFSQRARVNGPLFLVGWVLGLTVLVTVAYLLADAFDVGASSAADDGVSWLKLVLGVLLALLAARKWRNRPAQGEEPTMPSWMAGVDQFSPAKAFGMAVVLASANPKNLALGVGAAATLAQQPVSTSQAVVALAAFVLVGSSIVALAVGYDLLGGPRAQTGLAELKAWMTLHNDAVMAVLFLVFSAVLVSDGLGLRS
jgi:threonine/homoserine/homoserine lactone efflux protein